MTNVVFSVNGMTCGHCAKTVERSVRSLPGIREVHVELAKKELTAAFDEAQVDVKDIMSAVERVGYAASLPGRGAQ